MEKERYEVIRKSNEEMYHKELPIIVKELNTAKDVYTGKEVIDITIRNIGNKTIKAVDFYIEFFDNLNTLKDKKQYTFENLELTINTETNFICDVNSTKVNMKDIPKIKIYEIRFADNEKITQEYVLEDLKNTDEVDKLGELANQYKREVKEIKSGINVKAYYHDFGDYWHCVCGNYYFKDVNTCPDCNIEKNKLVQITDKKYLTKRLEEYEKKQEEIKEKTIQGAKKVGNKTLKIAIIIVIAVIIGVIAFFIGKDMSVKSKIKANEFDSAAKLTENLYEKYAKYIYQLADQYANKGDLIKEYNILKATSDYVTQYKGKDTLDEQFNDRYIDVMYQYFVKQYENKDYEECYSLLEILQNNEKYKDDETLLRASNEVKYNTSLKLIETQEYEQAINLLETIDESYEGRNEQIKEAKYLRGGYLFEGKNYTEANQYFEKMLEYKDAKEKYKEGMYYLAKEKFEKYKENKTASYDKLNSILSDFKKAEDFSDTKKYISEITEALKWEGTWHNQNKYLTASKYDIKIDYFNKRITYLSHEYYFEMKNGRMEMYYSIISGEYSGHYNYAVLRNNIITIKDTGEIDYGTKVKYTFKR